MRTYFRTNSTVEFFIRSSLVLSIHLPVYDSLNELIKLENQKSDFLLITYNYLRLCDHDNESSRYNESDNVVIRAFTSGRGLESVSECMDFYDVQPDSGSTQS